MTLTGDGLVLIGQQRLSYVLDFDLDLDLPLISSSLPVLEACNSRRGL
jgi:hypothetical protein